MAGKGPWPPPPPPPPPPSRPAGGGQAKQANPPPPQGSRSPGGQQQQNQQQPQQIPFRNSTRFSDLTPRLPIDEDDCRKRLTTYGAHTIRKVQPRDPTREKTTWAKVEMTKESWTPEEIANQVARLNNGKAALSVSDKKQSLRPFQEGQVNRLLDFLNNEDHDQNFQWSLVQIDQKIGNLKHGPGKETTSITCYVKRTPRPEINPIGLYQAVEKQKADRTAGLLRPPPQPQAQGSPPKDAGDKLPVGVIQLPAGGGGNKGGAPKDIKKVVGKVRGKHYHDSDSCSSDFRFDSESGSGYSSSENTSTSSRNYRVGRRERRNSQQSYKRKSSSSRLRKQHERFYIEDRLPPDPVYPMPLYGGGPRPAYVPDVPRGPDIDHIAVSAYHAGKIDADAERFAIERATRPVIPVLDRALVARTAPDPYDHPLSPRTPLRSPIISYERQDPFDRRESRLADERYIDELRHRDDLRYQEEERQREEDLIREHMRRRDIAEDYIEHRRRVNEPRIIYHAPPNPFSPAPSLRRHSRSDDSYGR